jgi:hypothetical protein
LPWWPFPGISTVGEGALDEREDAPRGSQKRSATIAVLDTRRMRFEHEAAPVRVHERMALTTVDFKAELRRRPRGRYTIRQRTRVLEEWPRQD